MGQARGMEVRGDGQRGWWGQDGGVGKLGHIAHLFTLMALQTPNSIHTLGLDRRAETEIRDGGYLQRAEPLRP